MKKLSETKKATTARVMVFGGPKAGKTQLAGELAEHGYKLIWIDMENGYETLFKLSPEAQDRITLVHLPDTRDYPIAIETCLKLVKGPVKICDLHGKVDCMLCKREETAALAALDSEDKEGDKERIHSDWFTDLDLRSLTPDTIVVFDSGTQLANSTIAHVTKNEDDTYKPTYDDWGNMGKLLDVFYSRLQNAPYNVVVISHELEVETTTSKTKKVYKLVPVGGTRNFSRNVAKYFGHVVYMEQRGQKHEAHSKSTYMGSILTGSRTDVAVESMDKPSLLPIFRGEVAAGNESANKMGAANNAKASALLDKLKQGR